MVGEIQSNNKRIAKNTLMLYFRMVILMIVNLYLSRIVLKVLGVEDFGLYSVVGSIVTFMGFLNTSMAAASQRFLAFAKGKKDEILENSTFNSIFVVQTLLGLLLFVVCELCGSYYISNYLNVVETKITIAHTVFQFSLLSFVVNVMTVPYTASIMANERMDVFASFSMLDVFMKLGVAFVLQIFTDNRLFLYALMMFGCSVVLQVCYRIYCVLHFKECKIRKNASKNIIKEILSYSGWNMMGSFSAVLIDQGVNMILNSFFGVIVNAARGIAFQVSSALSQLCSNFIQAMNPQTVKAYAQNDLRRMHNLINLGTRFSFLLLFVFALPIIFNMKHILRLWLGDVPEYCETFCILAIINGLIGSLSQPLLIGALATGKIKKYQIIVASINMLNFPLSILVLNIWSNPYLTMIIMISLSITALIARLWIVSGLVGLSKKFFILHAVKPVFIVTVVATVSSVLLIIYVLADTNLFYVFFNILILFTVAIIVSATFGLTADERKMVFDFIKNKIR